MTREEFLAGICQGCGATRAECRSREICRSTCDGGYNTLIGKIWEWQNKTFPAATTLTKHTHLTREVKELGEALVRLAETDPLDSAAIERHTTAVRHELADCIFLLLGICGKLGFDPLRLLWEKFRINIARKWGKPDASGVVEHIREGAE